MNLDLGRFNSLRELWTPQFVVPGGRKHLLCARAEVVEGVSPLIYDTIAAVESLSAANPNEQYIGIEVELERVAPKGVDQELYDRTFFFWNLHDDGSLRNNGKEFVTNIGVSVSNAHLAVNSLEEYIKIATNGKAEANARTGLHVHMNVGGKTLEELCTILFLYALLEPVFFQVSGNRSDSIFCVPWHRNKHTLGSVINNVTNIANEGQYSRQWRWRNYSKYCALNIAPISTLGTIEFRMHRGTYQATEILSWVYTLNRLFQVAANTSVEELYTTFRTKRTFEKYDKYFDGIFQDYRFDKFAMYQECVEATLNNLVGFIDYGHLPEGGGIQYINNDVKPKLNLGQILENRLNRYEEDDDEFGPEDEPEMEEDMRADFPREAPRFIVDEARLGLNHNWIMAQPEEPR